MWRTTPIHRWEMTGSTAEDRAPALPAGLDLEDVQSVDEGTGPLVHRTYRVHMAGSTMSPQELMKRIAANLDRVAPSEFATFQKLGGDGPLAVDDEYVVRMPGPWDGPVRVIAADATSFRLATLAGHLEAGQIEFRSSSDHRALAFEIESWARSGDRLSDVLYSRLRLAKEVQLHMWTSVLERIVALSGGRIEGGITIATRRTESDQTGHATAQLPPRIKRRLSALPRAAVNFDASELDQHSAADGWRRDDLVQSLPSEAPGEPAEQGTWRIARRLIVDYQLADPRVVRAFYEQDAPLAERDMLLRIRFGPLRFYVGVRIGEVYDGTRAVDGRDARVFGWYYRTLEGHFESGQMNYELWKWLDTGEIEFRIYAVSQPAARGPFLLRTGFRLFGRTHQLRFYREICRRALRLTETQLQTQTPRQA